MTHQGPEAALGEGGSAHGRGSRRCCRGQHSKRCLLVPVSPGQLLPCQEGFALHLPECLPAERPEGELKWLRMGTRGKDRAGGLNQSTGSASAKHTQEASSHRSSEHSAIALLHEVCSEGDHRSAFTGNAAVLPAAPGEPRWAPWAAQVCAHCTPWPCCSS